MSKWVPVQPSSSARRFISSTKASTVEVTCKAATVTASFADSTMMAYINCSMVTISPTTRSMP